MFSTSASFSCILHFYSLKAHFSTFQTFYFEAINVRNKGTMMVTNQERVREFRGTSMQVFGGGTFTAVDLHVHVVNFTIDALAKVHATLEGEKFDYEGMFDLNALLF